MTKHGWDAAYGPGAMFVPELVECDVAVNGDALVEKCAATVPLSVAKPADGCITDGRGDARPAVLPNATTAIRELLEPELRRQANG